MEATRQHVYLFPSDAEPSREGFVTAMHDVAPAAGHVRHVAIFNPGSNRAQVSRLRLVNLADGSTGNWATVPASGAWRWSRRRRSSP